MILIGEKINGTRKKVAEAILARDSNFIAQLSQNQFNKGAKYIDINAGTPPQREADDLIWLIHEVKKACPEAIICLDSANPEALAKALEELKKYNPEKIMINSLSGEKSRIEGVLPLAAENKTELIILALDDKGIAETAEGRLEIIRKLINMCREKGMADELLYIDPLVLTIATNINNGIVTLNTLRAIKKEFPKVHLTCGHSNISFGMPLRSVINQAFMALTIEAGLDSAICDPEDRGLKAAILASKALLGQDRHCLKFNKAFRAKEIG